MSAVVGFDADYSFSAAPPAHWSQLLIRNRNGRIGILVLLFLLAVAVATALGVLPYPPLDARPADALQAPSTAHWLGTDQFGRDVASRLAAGVLASLRIAVVCVALSTAVGGITGISGGFFGGWLDRVFGRAADILFAFPAILLALTIITALGTGWLVTALAIAIVYTPIFFRVARGPVLSLRSADFILAGRVLGFSSTRLLFRHMLPNIAAPLIVQVALALSWAILTEATLSFLGLGTQPPNPSLGLMVNEGRPLVFQAWWLVVFPSTVIVVAVIGLNLLGDGLRDAFDPKRSG